MTDEEKLKELMNKISLALKDATLQQGFEVICKKLADLEKENAELKTQIDQLSNDNHILKTAFITQKEQIEYLNSEILQMRCPGNCNNANSEKCSSSCYDCEYYKYND